MAFAARSGNGGEQIRLIIRDNVGELFLLEYGDDLLFRIADSHGGIDHKDSDVGFSEDTLRFLHTQTAQLALVVIAGGVDYHDRTHGQYLHRLFDRVGRRSAHIGDHGKLLTGDGIHQA